MSSESKGESALMGLIVASIAMLGFFVIGIVAGIVLLVTIKATILAVRAWNHTIETETTILTPAIARAFILRGVFFAALAGIGCRLAWGPESGWLLFAIIGYAFGATGIELILEKTREEEEENLPAVEIIPPQAALPSCSGSCTIIGMSRYVPAPAPVPPRVVPFRFADWDDEEARR